MPADHVVLREYCEDLGGRLRLGWRLPQRTAKSAIPELALVVRMTAFLCWMLVALPAQKAFAQSFACCLPDGSCLDTTGITCSNQNGNPQELGSVCPGDRACCFPDDPIDSDKCEMRFPDCCQFAHGESGCPAHLPAEPSYPFEVCHDFGFPDLGLANITKITWEYKLKSKARTRRCRDKCSSGREEVDIPLATLLCKTKNCTSLMQNSTASAFANLEIRKSTQNSLEGRVRAHGYAKPDLTPRPTCSSNKRKKTAFAKSFGYSKLVVEVSTGTADMHWVGCWENNKGNAFFRKGRRKLLRDPVIARLTDHDTGQISTWTLCSVRSVVGPGGGGTAWGPDPSCPPPEVCHTLRNTAENMTFDAVVDSPVVPAAKHGTLRIVVENGLTKEVTHTGVFATLQGQTGVPSVGSLGNFAFALPTFEFGYDLNLDPIYDPLHNNTIELVLDGGGHGTALPGENLFDECTIINDIGTGFDGSDVSAPRPPDPGDPGDPGDADLGFNARHNHSHAAILIAIPPGPPVELDAILIPIFQSGAPVGAATIQRAYAQLWSDDPRLGGIVIGGDMVNDRLDVDENGNREVDGDIDVFRVPRNSPTENDNSIQEAVIDLEDFPLLSPGDYYLEMAFEGLANLSDPQVVPCPWPEAGDGALIHDVAANQWRPALDSLSGRPLDFCATIFAGYATCEPLPDGSGCANSVCPDSNDICRPTEQLLDLSTGHTTVTQCDCVNAKECFLEPPASVPPASPVCIGQHCPGTNGPCELTTTQNTVFGTCIAGICVAGRIGMSCTTDQQCDAANITYDCCAPGCAALADGSGCTAADCPGPCVCVGGSTPGQACDCTVHAQCLGGGICPPGPRHPCKPSQLLYNPPGPAHIKLLSP